MCAHVSVQLQRLSAEVPAHGALALRQSVFSPHHRANPEQHQAGVQAHAEEETSGEQLPADRLLLPPRLTATLLRQQHSHTARRVLWIGVPLQTRAAAVHAEAGGHDLRASAEGARGEGARGVRRDPDHQTRRTIRCFREVHPRPVDEAVRGAAGQLCVLSGVLWWISARDELLTLWVSSSANRIFPRWAQSLCQASVSA